ncbi:hypothetical protein JW979_12310 [bacterium]|nr:hypothetical protein [candidate division CSSED10-310 bacterium]
MKRQMICYFLFLFLAAAAFSATQKREQWSECKPFVGRDNIHAYIKSLDTLKKEYFEKVKHKLKEFTKSEFETTDEFKNRVTENLKTFVNENPEIRQAVHTEIQIAFPVSFQYLADERLVVFEAKNIFPDYFLKNLTPGDKPGYPYSVAMPSIAAGPMRAPAFVNHENFYYQARAVPVEKAKLLRENENDNIMYVVLHFDLIDDYLTVDPDSGPPATPYYKPLWRDHWLKITVLDCFLINDTADLEIPLLVN